MKIAGLYKIFPTQVVKFLNKQYITKRGHNRLVATGYSSGRQDLKLQLVSANGETRNNLSLRVGVFS